MSTSGFATSFVDFRTNFGVVVRIIGSTSVLEKSETKKQNVKKFMSNDYI